MTERAGMESHYRDMPSAALLRSVKELFERQRGKGDFTDEQLDTYIRNFRPKDPDRKSKLRAGIRIEPAFAAALAISGLYYTDRRRPG